MSDLDIIYLQPLGELDSGIGRVWCQDDVWGEDSVEYWKKSKVDKLIQELKEEINMAKRAEIAKAVVSYHAKKIDQEAK